MALSRALACALALCLPALASAARADGGDAGTERAWIDDWKMGAILETSYRHDAPRGDTANIRQRVLAYLPLRMLVFQTTDAPPG